LNDQLWVALLREDLGFGLLFGSNTGRIIEGTRLVRGDPRLLFRRVMFAPPASRAALAVVETSGAAVPVTGEDAGAAFGPIGGKALSAVAAGPGFDHARPPG
jgi:hypothetical protein